MLFSMHSPNLPNTENELRARAQRHIQAQQWLAAQVALEALLERRPEDVATRMELARAMLRQGLMRASATQLVRAAQSPVSDVQLNIQLVQRLCFSGEIEAARACLARFERLSGLPAQVLAAQAHLRWMLGEFDASRSLVERALAAGADMPGEHHMHAMLLQFSGEIERAGQVLETCLRRWPSFGTAAVALSNLRKQTPATQHVDFLQQQLARFPARDANPEVRFARAEFAAALFKEFDDLGQHESAWQALALSNALMHELNPYDAAGEAAVTDALIDASRHIGSTDAKLRPTPQGPVPIFIVGMPRSGTTLLDRMLSCHSQVRSAGEINDGLRQLHWVADVVPAGVQGMLEAVRRSRKIDFAELGARYLQQTRWRAQGRPYYIDKLPGNIQMVAFIRRALPHAPILHMVRDPMDVCFSNFKAMFGNISAYSYDMKTLAHYYRLYVRLVRHWHATLPGAMLDVSYEALVSDPATTLRGVLEHCGLAIEDACLHPERNEAPIATPSSIQVREPIHTRAVGQWRHYASQLRPLRELLAHG
jgi:tetratricopeptide (TPR) repeat protein